MALLLIRLTACAPTPADTRPTDASAGITTIVLERNSCLGCLIDKVLLRADGTALYTGKEQAERTGHFTGSFRKEEFGTLAQWLASQGFFEMKMRYGDPHIEAPSQVIRIVRKGREKFVMNNERGRSETLWIMHRVIQGVAAEIRWQPMQSGIRGVTRPKATILIHPSNDKLAFRIRADGSGAFEVPLVPGTYTVEVPVFSKNPQFPKPPPTNPVQTLAVQTDQWVKATF
jgi:hypothetical protein